MAFCSNIKENPTMEVEIGMIYFYYYDTVLGKIGAAEKEGKLIHLSLQLPIFQEEAVEMETPLLKKVQKELTEYFLGQRKAFDIPLNPMGTEFQKKVWQALLEIPYGETCSYGEIAKRVQNPRAARAVGMANHHNPIMILIPCHRVVGAKGKLVGYAGGIDKKKVLLHLEKGQAIV
jgi:methylated-DNA-[protein]-cysteine S-methyltransferase